MADVSTQYFLGNTEIIKSYIGNKEILINPQNFTPAPYTIAIDYLVMAGGGSSGGGGGAGGGGGGGYISGSVTIAAPYTASLYVGAGGVFDSASPTAGGNSYIIIPNGTYTSIGGGIGADGGTTSSTGGSGGGGSWFFAPSSGTTSQGNAGGSFGGTFSFRAGGGGGGAESAGSNGSGAPTTGRGGDGGAGKQWLDGNYYGGGGGGATPTTVSYRAPGGIGGGGTGCGDGAAFGIGGTPNTGGGAGAGAGLTSGVSGGSGIVIFRYEDGIIPSGSITGGDNVYVSASYVYHEFLQTGSAVLSLN